MKLKAEPVKKEDLHDLFLFINSVRAETYMPLNKDLKSSSFELDSENLKRKITNYKKSLNKDTNLSLIIKDNKEIVAYLKVTKLKRKNKIKSLFIKKQYQGKGLGSYLTKEAIKWCDPTKDTILDVVKANKQAIDFYKKHGFTEDKVVSPFTMNNVVLDRIQMKLK